MSMPGVMRTRLARAGVVLSLSMAVLAATAAPATAKAPRAHASVIGGRVASLSEWGFAASLATPHTLCTGVVIAPTKVLTAAHCAISLPSLVVRTNSTSAFGGGEVSGVSSAAIAPGFSHGFENDVAVLTLGTPTTATPIQLATPAEDATYSQAGAPLAVAGFGNRNPILGRQKIGLLTAAEVRVRRCALPGWAICDSGGRAGAVLRQIHHRWRKRKVKKTICSGDSGGPLVARTPSGPRLVGIAEASSGPRKPNPFFFVICGLKGFPSLHTNLSGYLPFILGSG